MLLVDEEVDDCLNDAAAENSLINCRSSSTVANSR